MTLDPFFIAQRDGGAVNPCLNAVCINYFLIISIFVCNSSILSNENRSSSFTFL